MTKLITANTCPYGLKCWAYLNMLGLDIDLINVDQKSMSQYVLDPEMEGKIPFMHFENHNLYDSKEICSWLLLEFSKNNRDQATSDLMSDFDKYTKYESYFIDINKSLFKYALDGFNKGEAFDLLNFTIIKLKKETGFHNERREISFALANLAGFLCRFSTFHNAFQDFIQRHDLADWLAHAFKIINPNKDEYLEFGTYFNRFVEAKK